MRYDSPVFVQYIDSLMYVTETIQRVERAGKARTQRVIRRRLNGTKFDHDKDGRQLYRWRRGQEVTIKGATTFLSRYELTIADFEKWARKNKKSRKVNE